MLSRVNCTVGVHEGVMRRGGDEVQVMTKCILASHLSVGVMWRPERQRR